MRRGILVFCLLFYGALAGPAHSVASANPTLDTPPTPPGGVLFQIEPPSSANFTPSPEFPETSYSDLVRMADQQEIASVEISRRGEALLGVRKDGSKFFVTLNPQWNVADRMVSAGADVKYVAPTFPSYQPGPGVLLMDFLYGLGPWIIVGVFLIFIFRLVFRHYARAELRTERIIVLLEESNRLLGNSQDENSRKLPAP